MTYLQDLGFIGQSESVTKLNNYIQATRNKKHFFPPIALFGARGFGKTQLAKCVASCLLSPDNVRPKSFIEIQGSTVKSKRWFIDNIVIRHLNVGPCSLFIDEIHDLPLQVKNWIMPLLYPNKDGIVQLSDDNADYTLNYDNISVIIATTDSHRLSGAFVSRCVRVDLGGYEYSELAEIAKRGLAGLSVEITEPVMPLLVKAGRKTPRTIVNLTRELRIYCLNNEVEVINLHTWGLFCASFNVKPLGLYANEIQYLRYLLTGPKTLTMLASKLKLEPSTVREDTESYLIDEDLITIDKIRTITPKGIQTLKDVDAQLSIILNKQPEPEQPKDDLSNIPYQPL